MADCASGDADTTASRPYFAIRFRAGAPHLILSTAAKQPALELALHGSPAAFAIWISMQNAGNVGRRADSTFLEVAGQQVCLPVSKVAHRVKVLPVRFWQVAENAGNRV